MKAATVAVKAEGFSGDISIHAAREGGDSRFRACRHPTQAISIHAAREGGDPIHGSLRLQTLYFNPRRP